MKFSETFSFLTILKESFQILPRNGKLTASTALLSLALPSILIPSFIHIYRYLTDTFLKASYDSGLDFTRIILKYLAPLFLVEITFLLVFFIISHVSGIATILISSASYTGNYSLSTKDLWTSIKRTWRKPLFYSPPRSWTNQISAILLLVPVYIGIMHPNIFTISGAVIVGTVLIGFQLYSSVVWALSVVVMVLEEGCTREMAMEKAGELVKGGHQLRGFVLNLFINLACLVVISLVWVFSWKGSVNAAVLGLVFVNALSVMKMVLFTAYTVLYFQCKKDHGEDIHVGYTKLSSSSLVVDDDDHEIP